MKPHLSLFLTLLFILPPPFTNGENINPDAAKFAFSTSMSQFKVLFELTSDRLILKKCEILLDKRSSFNFLLADGGRSSARVSVGDTYKQKPT